ncbi:hypothetical protein GCM10007862_10060 [Dyella lipolytica]|uniref:DUF4331 domain-containing protein n=1 Tax=Dyella lipolytica TaxID=1867835 RepID=A0ABW8IZQ0_9GAMM|nr:DUF4331 domain-containing protein [Dyella lipolytica]GLQ45955.1 hypothetical protein GCM10007862_10060 [Dyella lipolytica]
MKLKPLFLALTLVPVLAIASSHREAPFISTMPQVDGSDFYMFMSYETGRQGYVTFLANYNPLQTPGGGPNFYALDPNAYYDIHIDNAGHARSDLTFRFRFTNTYKNLAVPTGANGQPIAVPLLNIGGISSTNQNALNRIETYTVELIDGNPETARGRPLVSSMGGSPVFTKPVDNIGFKSINDYANYANNYVYDVVIPGCSGHGRVFAGQRKDGFVADLGEIFDLVNLNPLGSRESTHNALTDKNVDTLALEIPAACLRDSQGSPVIGAWTTASIPRHREIDPDHDDSLANASNEWSKDYVQVSRLGQPLVNELVIGLPDKDKFNGSHPHNDAQFLKYVTNPTLPVLVNALFGAAVPHTPRYDLITVFLTGVPGLNQPAHVTPSEELRLNTSTPPTPPAKQNDLGVLGGDLAGFPNGRRPYDDVVDIALRVEEGALCGPSIGVCGDETKDPNSGAPFTDGARSPGPTVATEKLMGDEYPADTYLPQFPYLMTPLPGSPNGVNGVAAN